MREQKEVGRGVRGGRRARGGGEEYKSKAGYGEKGGRRRGGRRALGGGGGNKDWRGGEKGDLRKKV